MGVTSLRDAKPKAAEKSRTAALRQAEQGEAGPG